MDLIIRNILGWCLASLLIWLGYVKRAKLRALAGEFILSIYFHNPTVKEFESCIRWLIKSKFRFLSLGDVEELIKTNKMVPAGCALITIDDGWALNRQVVVEIAHKYRIPVGIFISTGPVEEGTFWWSYVDEANRLGLASFRKNDLKKLKNEERLETIKKLKKEIQLPREALTVEQVKEIAKSPFITIGSHTLTHPILVTCNYQQVHDELYLSKEKLQKWLSKEVKYFAYPNGTYAEREINMIQKANYSLAFTTVPDYLRTSTLKRRFELPRFEVCPNRTFAETICRITGVWQPCLVRLSAAFRLRKRASFWEDKK
ncbi:polysaccharide deacetylase family protein [Pontibacter sp. H249]|uniref:polysaccharide deacetylase family protein n=1 Tax=Pontibacter sp. H249 TaxID=3133420 RepID=UPI0030C380FC